MDETFKRQYMNEVPKDAVGLEGGLCNRTACRAPGANYFNWGSRAWYCASCAFLINDRNRPDTLCVKDGVGWEKLRDESDRRREYDSKGT